MTLRLSTLFQYRPWLPTFVVLFVCVVVVFSVLAQHQFDPMALVDYDGYFPHHIARWGFDVEKTAPLMDKVAYRYQRILYPFAARVLALGQPLLVPWALIVVNIMAIGAGARLMEILLEAEKTSGWYALVYGLYGGQLLALLTSLTEPLSFSLVLAAMLAWKRDRTALTAVFFALGILAKETAVLFVAGFAFYYLLRREWRHSIIVSTAILPYLGYQVFLFYWLGETGLGATEPFIWFPFGGWLQGLRLNPYAFFLVSLSIVPMTIIPTIAGLFLSVRSLFKRLFHPYVTSLLANCVFIMILPFATLREPSAMIRITQGLVISMLLYGALIQSKRILNYTVLWLFTSVILVKGSGRAAIKHFD